MKSKVSIIVPIYNSGELIRRCLDSLLNQTYSNIEVLLIDDGSTDQTPDIIKEYLTRTNKFCYYRKENQGPSATRNYGIRLVQGDYVCFVDADDVIDPTMIEKLVDLIESDDYDFVRANYYYSTDENIKYAKGPTILNQSKEEIQKQIIVGTLPTFVWLLLIKHDYLKQFTFNETIDYMEDKVFYFSLFTKSDHFLLSDQYLYYYYFNDNKNRSKEYWLKYLKNVNLVFEDIQKLDKGKNSELIRIIAFSQINTVLSKITSNLSIKKTLKTCNPLFINKIPFSKYNSFYINLCALMCNIHWYFGLKCLYQLKKISKKVNK